MSKSYQFEKVIDFAKAILIDLREHRGVVRAELVGECRRYCEAIHSFEFLVETRDPEAVSAFFVQNSLVQSVGSSGLEGAIVTLDDGLEARLSFATKEEFPFVMNALTGSTAHREHLADRAAQCGFRLEERGLRANVNSGSMPVITTEEELYGAFGLSYIEPELREGRGEVEASLKGALPRLVEVSDLRGTFHCHTVASDGGNTIEEQAAEAKRLGFEYLGISDHSRASHGGLDCERLLAQVEEIKVLNRRLEGIHLFSGIECDILFNGVLDLPDETLSQVDFVVASLHSHLLGDDPREVVLTDRIIKAISNPYVTMLGHASGRGVAGKREYNYKVNIPAIIDAAAETGTIIELNSAPFRMDLAPEWWPYAKEKGVLCSINPDAHHTVQLKRVYQGVRTARRGWLTAADVINTLPLAEVKTALRRKRRPFDK